MKHIFAVLSVALIATGCGSGTKRTEFAPLAEEFVYTSLSFSPAGATQTGYHRHNGVVLDELLDDLSPDALDRQRQFYRGFQERLVKSIRPEELSAEERADYDILSDQISLALLELDRIQNYRHNPTLYVESVGNALFGPFILEYDSKPQRMRHIIARLEKVPAFYEQAKKNLVDSPEIWNKVAQEENEGNIGLIDKAIRAEAPEELRKEYDAAAGPALAAARNFQEYLKNDLAKRNARDWRLGGELYGRKFRYALATDLEPDEVLAQAEADLKSVRAKMLELALPLHRRWFPARSGHEGLEAGERENRVISETLSKIAERHSTREAYIGDARRDLEEARQFVKEKNLLKLPPRDNLQVIPTPGFMRGIYAVGGFASAPALQPELGAFYWITPIPQAWPRERMESKLREYNFYKLKLLTIHEAMPGHYVQLEYANDVQPAYRRVLRSVFGNGPYIEGWGQYSTQVMLDEGYLNHAPELRLTFQKEELRVIANAILDVRLHTKGMTDQEALDLMQNLTFQEKEEATAKLRRAKLSSCQLPTYLVGWRDWIRVREHYQRAKGSEATLAEFHGRALSAGSVPLPVLARLLTGVPLKTATTDGAPTR
ncbi:MAG: DUF885 domain-containing protein [Bryobacteraceae bacterium]